MNNITDSLKKERCSGCLSCIDACPTNALYASKDYYGFVIPEIDKKKCINCGKCILACPYNNKISTNYLGKTYAVLNKKNDIIKKSSSGGVFFSLAKKIIEQNGYVIGATMDRDFQVKHICIDSVEDIRKLQKSKYIQSDTNGIYRLVKKKLTSGKKVLFTGTPCQVYGLKSYLNDKNYDNLICMDVVCHGVPNQDFFNDYIKYLSKKEGQIEDYEFRTKKEAANGMNWFFSYKLKGKKKRIIKNWPEDSYNFYYMKKLIYRESCYGCMFAKKERASDITLCDYWSWNRYHSKDFENFSSVSGCIINTEKGQEIFNLAKDDFIYVNSNYNDLSRHNKNLMESDLMSDERTKVLNCWKNMGYEYLDKEFKKKNKKQIIKYRILMMIPKRIKGLIKTIIKER